MQRFGCSTYSILSYLRLPLLAAFFLLPATVCAWQPELTWQDFTREPDYRGAKLSPNGRYLAALWNNNGVRTLTIHDLDAPGQPVIGGVKGDVKRPKSFRWVNNDRLLVTLQIPLQLNEASRAAEEEEDFNLYDYLLLERVISVDTRGGDQVVLMNDQPRYKYNRRLSQIMTIKNDDRHVLMQGYRNGAVQIFKVNVFDGTTELVAKGGKRTVLFLIDDDGVPTHRVDYFKVSNKAVILSYLKEDKWEELDTIDFDDEEDAGGIDLFTDYIGWYGNRLVYRKRNEETGYYELVARDLETGDMNTLVSLPGQDVGGIVVDDHREIIGYYPVGDLVRFKFFSEQDQSRYDHLAGKFGNYNFNLFGGASERRSVYQLYGRDQPSAYYLYDKGADSLRFIQNGYLGLPAEKLGIPAKARYKARDGLIIDLFLLLPPNYEQNKAYPLVLYPHGGPRSRDYASWDDFAQFMATRGYIVAQPNFRGSAGYGRAFEEAGYKQWGLSMQDDLEDATNFLLKKGYVEKGKMCIVGGSYGGYAALMATIKTPELFQCSVAMNAVTDLVAQVNHQLKWAKAEGLDEVVEYLYKTRGNPKQDADLLNSNSPALHAEAIKTPILLIAGKEDSVVPHSQAKAMRKALKKYDRTFEYIELKNTGHNVFYYKKDQEQVYQAVESFLAKYLQ
ncbi:alpha/beta hydrolase family protein [Halioxenophilus sp. WMMB6]|uniref:alpha/beta hydrolase family protein n=1 Tax=Halioxenophilus sp. WMMB6 TaxID=3073815 RepID=UPI00295EA968|nr:prolyl oligopeptidase family serine peptidase [Halioxenophilus sp. WMMB6]